MSSIPAPRRTLNRASRHASSGDASLFLDWATICGGALLTGIGLKQNGLRGWLPISLGTLVLFRGIVGLAENRLYESGKLIGNERHDTIPGIPGVNATYESQATGDPAAMPD